MILKSLIILIILFFVSTIFTFRGDGPSTHTIINYLFSQEIPNNSVIESILYELRIPRNILALLSGASLALAGAVSQGIFRNSLASPSVIGTNSGGVLAAILVFYFGLAWESQVYLSAASIIGSCFSTILVLAIFNHQKMQSLGALLLLGFALNAFLSGLTSFTLSFLLNDYEKSTSALRWMLGSYASASWHEVRFLASTFATGLILAYPLAYKIDLLSLGEDLAKTSSINVTKLKNLSIIALAILVGGSISVAGGIPFVGLIVPHISRQLVGPRHKKLFITSILNGAILTLFCDLIARNIRFPEEIEMGAITTLLGAPFFIWLLISNQKKKESNI